MQSLGQLIGIFGIATIVVIFCGVRLTRVCERFADLSGLGQALTGAILLGAMTSLAGSVASVSAAASGSPNLALSNAIGGIAAQTFFLVIADLCYRKANLEHAAASLPNMVSGALLIILLMLILMGRSTPDMQLLGVHPVTPILLAAYIGGLMITRRTRQAPMWRPDVTDQTREDEADPLKVETESIWLVLLYTLGLGAAVAVAGYFIAQTGLAIADRLNVRAGIIGALLTSVATSTPELVTTVAAVRRGALTLAVAGIIGGNTFDTLFAAFSDIAYREGSIYHAISPDQIFLTELTILMTAVLLLGLLRRERTGPGNIGFESTALLAIYGIGMVIYVWAF